MEMKRIELFSLSLRTVRRGETPPLAVSTPATPASAVDLSAVAGSTVLVIDDPVMQVTPPTQIALAPLSNLSRRGLSAHGGSGPLEAPHAPMGFQQGRLPTDMQQAKLPPLPRPIVAGLVTQRPDWAIEAAALTQFAARTKSGNEFDVTVVLNLHREANYLQRTILSLNDAVSYARYKEGLKFEIVVVMDNPDAAMRAVVTADKFRIFDACKIIEVANGSLALSRNAGIAEARGAYVATCDADDLLSFNMFAELYATAQAHGPGTAVFPNYLFAFGEDFHLYRLYDSTVVPAVALFDYHPYVSRIFLETGVAKANPYRHAEHRAGYAYEDWWINAELLAQGFRFAVALSTVIYYRQRVGSLLKEANASAQPVIQKTKLFEPRLFAQFDRTAFDYIPDGSWRPPEAEDVRGAFLQDPVVQAATEYANAIDPVVNIADAQSCITFTNLYGSARKAKAYARACAQLNADNYDDVLILPFLTAGGGERYMLNILSALQELGASRRVLFLCGEHVGAHTWLDRMPRGADFVDLHDVAGGDPETIDVITLRLLQFVGEGARIHVKPSPYAHRFARRYARQLLGANFIYYRFSDPVALHGGRYARSGWAFSAVSDQLDLYQMILSDHKAIGDADKRAFGVGGDRWRCVYNFCPTTEHAPRIDTCSRRLVWANRIAPEKRPDLLIEIIRELGRYAPDVHVSIYGYSSMGDYPERFADLHNATYHGGYAHASDIPFHSFAAAIYTSSHDGLPNGVLEAMAHGLPVISPSIGGLPETIEDRVNGFLVPTTGADSQDAHAYVSTILEALDEPSALDGMGARAHALVKKRHHWEAFKVAVAREFDVKPKAEVLGLAGQLR
jgi:glycosyltransferase involved in cell wall biosynthesis